MKRQHVESSNIESIGYDERSQTLEIEFLNGGVYQYFDVPVNMYPEKLTFDGERLRTTRINEAARMIYTLDKAFSENEKGQSGNIPALSSQVGMTGFEPATPTSRT